MLSDDHARINRDPRTHEERAPLLQILQSISCGFALLFGDHDPILSKHDGVGFRNVRVKTVVHDPGAARASQQFVFEPNQGARSDHIL